MFFKIDHIVRKTKEARFKTEAVADLLKEAREAENEYVALKKNALEQLKERKYEISNAAAVLAGAFSWSEFDHMAASATCWSDIIDALDEIVTRLDDMVDDIS